MILSSSREEIGDISHTSGLKLKNFLNTHHKLYQELKIKIATEEE